MSNTTPHHTDQAVYNGEHVMILHVEAQDGGNEALISYKDGREEYVPLSSLNLL
jgi:hypothetical protein